MFTHHCTDCHRTQLIFDSQVTAVAPVATGHGVELTFECWCGAAQRVVQDLAAA